MKFTILKFCKLCLIASLTTAINIANYLLSHWVWLLFHHRKRFILVSMNIFVFVYSLALIMHDYSHIIRLESIMPALYICRTHFQDNRGNFQDISATTYMKSRADLFGIPEND